LKKKGNKEEQQKIQQYFNRLGLSLKKDVPSINKFSNIVRSFVNEEKGEIPDIDDFILMENFFPIFC